ncbi:hypothetical protein E2562_033289 [Oryza meyeriana var. granulata]|uniref:Uncharacterized protein n=1 Tax=Oryza meyeriana var. granulata TaxID=110450 RepID=A0A6G1CW35_9ORYZ|nr:hypothetical protein E2562_033289 [Oryza meyeriana var. granulata]
MALVSISGGRLIAEVVQVELSRFESASLTHDDPMDQDDKAGAEKDDPKREKVELALTLFGNGRTPSPRPVVLNGRPYNITVKSFLRASTLLTPASGKPSSVSLPKSLPSPAENKAAAAAGAHQWPWQAAAAQ